ncbi:hydrogenase maturation protease [Streptomyces sp. NBC_01217]|uniref:hydrogenase maturation protease n=1 Tax=Streptomyces sp. NBC_01217 TaxID=2903779 RepID=UPI002E0E7387|nr:hydrogenase maturation protease [Streptomyces sp. NBC_01217]
MTPPRAQRATTLVAGVGNIFLGDDGFGVETVRRLASGPLPGHVEAVDIGVRGVHLAYQLLDGYDTLILVDATRRGGDPGTLYLIEPGRPGRTEPQEPLLDGHRMTPDAVLTLLETLCAGTGCVPPRRTLVVGCEPDRVDEGIGLSGPVAAAVPEAVNMVLRLVQDDEPTAPTEPSAARPAMN